MTTNTIYKRILEEMPAGIEKSIMTILADGHIGADHRIPRKTLVFYLYQEYRHKPVTMDREMRLAIRSLQENGYPILSDAGEGGYWIGRRDEVETYIRELESRRDSIHNKILALRHPKHLTWIDPEKPPVQGSFL